MPQIRTVSAFVILNCFTQNDSQFLLREPKLIVIIYVTWPVI